MAEPANFLIPVDGDLNSSDPVSRVPVGTLVDATDLAHRSIGPRPGRSLSASAKGLTGVGRSVYEFDGVDDYVLFPYNAGQMVLGLEWTLNLLFEPTAVGADSGTVFVLGDGTHRDIWVDLEGTGSGGSNPRTVKCHVQASTSGGASGSLITAQDPTQRTLASAGTPAQDPTLMIHCRVVRSTTALAMYVNGTLTSNASLSSTVGHAYVGAGIYLGSKHADAGDYFGGWIYKAMLQNGVFTDLQDGWCDIPHTKVPNVLFYATGGPYQQWVGSTSPANELSRFRNFGITTGSPATDTLTQSPLAIPIQGMNHYTDRSGRVHNLVCVNGRLFYERAT